jgi:Na+/serine symporter
MKSKTIRIITAVLAFLLILSALFFWSQFSLEQKYGDIITLYMLQDFSAIVTLVLSSLIIILQLIKPKQESSDSKELID